MRFTAQAQKAAAVDWEESTGHRNLQLEQAASDAAIVEALIGMEARLSIAATRLDNYFEERGETSWTPDAIRDVLALITEAKERQ